MPKSIGTIIIIPIVLVLTALFQGFLNKKFDYQCGNCGGKFSISPIMGTLAPHSMGRKLVKCPKCGVTSWATRVPKN
ncbi:hypothetical protein REC12_16560 [Desulfosporosinus sp. PR]|uniref:hypothetical protein n=1 Tax=Candidatus Desulfosporosinus nitrosoreducens TaxID=3401928 RepID=UPI0027E8579D|nr:hypothetical protein [Desulfosporosinus sp. PR]MDQ7095211.1 hypothetical protein [Desulfosporosinus sp. PR]